GWGPSAVGTIGSMKAFTLLGWKTWRLPFSASSRSAGWAVTFTPVPPTASKPPCPAISTTFTVPCHRVQSAGPPTPIARSESSLRRSSHRLSPRCNPLGLPALENCALLSHTLVGDSSPSGRNHFVHHDQRPRHYGKHR